MNIQKLLEELNAAVHSRDWNVADTLIKTLESKKLKAGMRPAFLELTSFRHLAVGAPQYALPFLSELVQLLPKNALARFNLGTALRETGELQESCRQLSEAVRIDPSLSAAWVNLGLVKKTTDRALEALQCFKNAYELTPQEPTAILNLAIAMNDVGNKEGATKLAAQIDSAKRMPTLEALEQFGLLLNSLSEFIRAAESFELLWRASGQGRHLVLWAEAMARGGHTLALEQLIRGGQWRTVDAADQLDLAKVLCVEGFLQESRAVLDELTEQRRQVPCFSFVYALLNHEMGQRDQARISFADSVRRGEAIEASLLMLGHIDRARGDSGSAVDHYKKILDLNPQNSQASYELALLLLEKGPAREAWDRYETRIHFFKRKNRFPVSGLLSKVVTQDDINGDTVVWSEQGLGESILFGQLLKKISASQDPPFLIASERLYNFFTYSGVRHFKPLSRADFYRDPSPYANEISLCSLGNVLDIDFLQPVITSTPSKTTLPRKISRVAISWASFSSNFGEEKTPPLPWFIELLQSVSDVAFISVQYDLASSDAQCLSNALGTRFSHPADSSFHNDLINVANDLSGCAFLITISNTTAHVAGSLGIPTLLLVPKSSGRLWYWHHETNGKSHWYPSVRIVAQEIDGDWPSIEAGFHRAIDTLKI